MAKKLKADDSYKGVNQMSNHISVFNQIYLSMILKLYKAESVEIFSSNFLSYRLVHKTRNDIILVLSNNNNSSCFDCFFDELSLFEDEEKNGNSYICLMPTKEASVEECTKFNGKSFVHFVFLDFQKKKIVLDKDFYYFGSKHIKKLMNICEEAFSQAIINYKHGNCD